MRTYGGAHREWRQKVTLADFYAVRLNALPVPWGSFEAAALMGAPVTLASRTPLRERVKLKPETLATRCKKYLTLGAVYTARETFAKRRNGPWPCTTKVGPGACNMAKWPGPGRAVCKVGGPVEPWPAPLELPAPVSIAAPRPRAVPTYEELAAQRAAA